MTDADAAEQRLRGWLRKSGRGGAGVASATSTQYGAVSGDFEDGAYIDLDDEKESPWSVPILRRCRRLCCSMFGLIGALGTGALITLIILSVQRNEVAFVALGDWGCGESNCKVPPSAPLGYQNGAENTRMVAAAMSASATAIGSQFVLALGDNFYFRGVQSVDDPLFAEVWEKQFVAPSLTTPWYVILGNHDHYGNPEAQIDFSRQARDCQDFKHCPNRWTLPRYWYSKQMKTKSFSVNFVFIDTVILCQGASEALAAEKARMGALNGADLERWNSWADERRMMAKLQMEWLRATLNASTAEWIIVAGHYPVYSGGEHGNTAELQHLVEPLLQHFRVDAYLCGHDHTLQHLKSRGVNYFVSGSGSFNGVFKELPQSLFGSIENGFTGDDDMLDRMEGELEEGEQNAQNYYRY